MRRCGWRDALERLAGRYPVRGARDSLTKPTNPETAPTKVGELRWDMFLFKLDAGTKLDSVSSFKQSRECKCCVRFELGLSGGAEELDECGRPIVRGGGKKF